MLQNYCFSPKQSNFFNKKRSFFPFNAQFCCIS